ncbi:MAG: hypothetical protein FWB83_08435, partial [Treponema sp.]|nr:hypothetical protein [Treponema sp.]
VASKSGVLKGSNLESLADLAGTLLSTGKADKKSASAKDGIGGLAAMIMGGSGTGANLASIASMAMKLGKKAEDEKELTGMASELGKTLSGSFGVSLGGSAKAVSGLSKTLEGDTKSVLFQSILKGIVK